MFDAQTLIILNRILPAFRAFVGVKYFPVISQLGSKGKCDGSLAVLAIGWRDICSVFAKRFEFCRQVIKSCAIFQPKYQRTCGTAKNNSGNQINPINHGKSPLFVNLSAEL